MILETIRKGSHIVDRCDPRHVARVVKIEVGFYLVRFLDSGWLGSIADGDAIPAPAGMVDDAPRRALMLAEVIR
jgi:hypothetical protein